MSSTIGSPRPEPSQRVETDDERLVIVCGELGTRLERERGPAGEVFPLVDLSEAPTCSALTSAAAAFGAATPKPRWPRLICLRSLGCLIGVVVLDDPLVLSWDFGGGGGGGTLGFSV